MDESVQPSAPQCWCCGYNLTGLPRAGRCPECGREYDLDRPFTPAKRPVLGFGTLAIIPLLTSIAIPAGTVTSLEGGLILLALTLIAVTYGGWRVSQRVARWRYAVHVRAAANEAAVRPEKQYVLERTVLFYLLHIALCVAFFVASVIVIQRLGGLQPTMP